MDSCPADSRSDSHGDFAGVSFVFVMSLWATSGILLLGLLLLPVWATLMAALAWQLQRWPAVSYRFSSLPSSTKPASRSVKASIGEPSPMFRAPGAAHRRITRPARTPLRPRHACHLHRRDVAFEGECVRPCFRCGAAHSRALAARRPERCRLNIACIRRPSSSRSRGASKRLRCLPSWSC